ncbi:DUF4007 family protein [Faecalibacter rhinopitheci]|uniref:DUF4007 family protein n=1 Tax=Faecalibacter rhinopitheci TaxID=2779678 RepID=A0A8J7KB35_9FLAO|nr:DUF4007 family protein [Faecalibacter rhinopitheci]MBF0598180.1 DUF4007 family protein [Faecalibacter rhinopitheci]
MNYRFSGHDTFHCKQQWLLKGFNNPNFSNVSESIISLGVGKNMVSSVKYWLEAFGITNENNLTEFSNLIFSPEEGLDRYLENEGTLWLLQYKLCQKKYASIFQLLFTEYFDDKVNYEFSEDKVIKFILNKLEINGVKSISENTLSNDFKVLTRTYLSSSKDIKNIEEEFNAPLLELNLIEKIESHKYILNKINRSIPLAILGYCILDMTQEQNSTSLKLEEIKRTIGNYFCITNKCLEDLLSQLNEISDVFVYTDHAGTATLDIKQNTIELREELLKKYYDAN